MKTLILEDEPLAADRLQRIIQKNFDQVEIAESIDTVKEGVKYLSEKADKLDFIFCDIHLADGSSFEIFDQLDLKLPVIFTTAYDQYSIDAFKVNSVQYLLKPLKEKEVIDAVTKYEILQGHKANTLDLSDLKRLLEKLPHEKNRRFLVKSGMRLIPKRVEEIALFYADHKIVHAIDKNDGKSYLTDFTLDELTSKHLDAAQFFRINRQQIVNAEVVTSIKPYPGQRLSLELSVKCNFDIIVSREKATLFKKWFVD